VFIAEGQFNHLVKTFVVNSADYKYFDVTSIEPNYGKFLVVCSCSTSLL